MTVLFPDCVVKDLLNFDFMDKPPAESLMRALEQLYALGMYVCMYGQYVQYVYMCMYVCMNECMYVCMYV